MKNSPRPKVHKCRWIRVSTYFWLHSCMCVSSKHVAVRETKRHWLHLFTFLMFIMRTVSYRLTLKASVLFSMAGLGIYIEIHWWPQTHTIHTHTWWKINLWGYPQCRQPEIDNSEYTPLNLRPLCLWLALYRSPSRKEEKWRRRTGESKSPPPPPPPVPTSKSSLFPEIALGIKQHRAGNLRCDDVFCCWIIEHYKRQRKHTLQCTNTH